jgi:iron complex transport system substrate-binding protein
LLALLRALALLGGCTSAGAGPAAGPGDTAGTVAVTDMAGRTVEVPAEIKSLCVLDPFAAGIAAMMGYGDVMTTTINNIKRNALMQDICPSLADAVLVKDNGDINAETLLEYGVDLAIISTETYADADECAKLDAINVPYLVVQYNSMAEQMDAVTLLGQALRREDVAEAYNSYYQKCIDLVAQGVADIPQDELPRVYHSVNEAVRTDYTGSLGADWIAVTKAVNVSLDTQLDRDGEKAYTALEQIFAWDPDIIICNEPGVADYILTDSKWAGLRAVREGHVLQMPVGISRWGHATSQEVPLALLWLVETLYPDRFDIDLETETRNFYREFFNYELSDDMLSNILAGTDIRTEKTAESAD